MPAAQLSTYKLIRNIWPDAAIAEQILKGSPALGLFKTDTKFGEKIRYVTVGTSPPQGPRRLRRGEAKQVGVHRRRVPGSARVVLRQLLDRRRHLAPREVHGQPRAAQGPHGPRQQRLDEPGPRTTSPRSFTATAAAPSAASSRRRRSPRRPSRSTRASTVAATSSRG